MQMKIEDLQEIMVRTSERTLFARCAWAWWMEYVLGWRPNKPSAALVMGDLVHQSLAAFYIPETEKKRRRGPHPAETYHQLCVDSQAQYMIKTEEEEFIDMHDLGVEMLTNYIDTYGKDDQFLIIQPEMAFQVKVYSKSGRYLYTYVGTTDALIRDLRTGRLGLFEHKTAKRINTSHLFLNEQSTSYWGFVPLFLKEQGMIKSEDQLTFMLYNYLRKGKKDLRPKNESGEHLNKPVKDVLWEKIEATSATPGIKKSAKNPEMEDWLRNHGIDPMLLGEVSKNQPPPLFHRELSQRGQVERKKLLVRVSAQLRQMNEIRSGEEDAFKSPDNHCVFCSLRDVCESEEIGTDWKELLHMTHTQGWNPYEIHTEDKSDTEDE